MHTVNILTNLIATYQEWFYLFLFLALIIEGEFILLATGVLLHLGAINGYATFLFVLLGLVSKTLFGYYLGTVLHLRWNHTRFLRYIEKRVSSLMPNFKRKPFWSIFISKFIIGANNIVIIFAGYQKVLFKRYLKAEFFSTLVWAPSLVFLGYVFSLAALRASNEIWKFSVIVIILTILFLIFDRFMRWIYEIFEKFSENAK